MSEHEGPHCDRCDYDLTGLTSDRCPECGKLIAFGWAIGGQSMTERRATPWDRRGGVGGFVRTWALAAFLPGRMARDFPARHSAASAVAYSLVCLELAAVVLLGLVLLGVPAARADNLSVAISVAASLGLLAGLYLALSFVPRVLVPFSSPLDVPWPQHFWRGLILFASGLVVPVAGAAGLLAITIWRDPPLGPAVFERYIPAAAILLALMLCWWWVVTAAVFRARGPRKAERLAVNLLIPLAFIKAMLAGAVVGAVAFPALYAIMELVRYVSFVCF